MLDLMSLTQIDTTPTPATNLQLSVKFTAGEHGSLIDPSINSGVTGTMQGLMADFLANAGDALTVSDPFSVIEAP